MSITLQMFYFSAYMLQGSAITIDSVAGPSSTPQSTWEKNRLTGSKEGVKFICFSLFWSPF